MLTLLLGGARSGKSTCAVRFARDHERIGGLPVRYLATAPHLDADTDFEERIAKHQAERPAHWETVEEPLEIHQALSEAGSAVVILDCLTLWVNNLRWRGDSEDRIGALAHEAARSAANRDAPTIVVSNEVGLGIHPTTAEGRAFRDSLGRVNQIWAAEAERVLLLVAGRALALHTVEEI